MYPSAELRKLEERKATLRREIAVARLQCLTDAAALGRTIGMIDRVVAQWKKISPLLKVSAVPLALLLKQRLAARHAKGYVGQALKWLPAVLSAAKMFSSARARH